MKRCAKCGRAYSDLVTTCSYCGSSLTGNTGASPAPKPPVQPTRPTSPPVQPTRLTGAPAQPARPVSPSVNPTPLENVGNGVLGALLFGLGGAVVQALLLNIGKVSAIAGIVCFLLAMSGYKKFSGIGDSPSKTALWVCAPVSLGMLFLGTVAGYAVYIANYVGIGAGADIQTLKKYTKDGSGMVLKASKENFQEAFVWLSSSMSVISRSDPSMSKVDLDPLPKSISVEL